jgi:hypothetical protein
LFLFASQGRRLNLEEKCGCSVENNHVSIRQNISLLSNQRVVKPVGGMVTVVSGVVLTSRLFLRNTGRSSILHLQTTRFLIWSFLVDIALVLGLMIINPKFTFYKKDT